MDQLFRSIFLLSENIRYVALLNQGNLTTSMKKDLAGASSAESDKYEELIVNPGILTLVKQRGNIDCGGADYVLIRYGNFFQFMMPTDEGHLSVSIAPEGDPMALVEPIRKLLVEYKLLGG